VTTDVDSADPATPDTGVEGDDEGTCGEEDTETESCAAH